MNYPELLRLASPEAMIVVVALIVLTLGLTRSSQGKSVIARALPREACALPGIENELP